jgi:molybdate transport system substrate-binding protein
MSDEHTRQRFRVSRRAATWLLALTLVLVAAPARADEIRVMVSGGFTAAYKVLVAEWEKATGHTVATVYGASMGETPTSIPNRLARGEPADIVVLARTALDRLADAGKVVAGSQTDLVRSRIGMAVKAGVKKPDISTEARFRQVLLDARSIAYSDSASGVYISTELFKKLGIADQVAGKVTMIPGTPVGEQVAAGAAEIGFQQMSELLPVPGITVVGPIPDSVQLVTTFSAGVATTARAPATARQLIAYLSSTSAHKVIRAAGLDPVAAALPTEGVDRFITVNGLRLHYLDWGNEGKPPFILLHGISRTAHTFDHVARRYQKDYHVIAIDMRGHGDSAWDPNAQYLVEDYVKDIEGIVGQLQLRNLVMMGNSTGGRVVQVMAGLHPDLVSRIVVEDVGPERPASIADGFAQRVQQERAEDTSWASEDELFAQTKKQNPSVSDEILRAYVKSAVKRRADGRLVWKRDPQLSKGFVVTELWRYIGKITCPTIYILGGKSTIVPVETQERLKKTIPGVEIVTVPDVGHYPDWEKPAETFAILDRFLGVKQ